MPGADNFKGDYKILQGRLCSEMYRLEPEEMPEDDWSFLAVRTRWFHKLFLSFELFLRAEQFPFATQ